MVGIVAAMQLAEKLKLKKKMAARVVIEVASRPPLMGSTVVDPQFEGSNLLYFLFLFDSFRLIFALLRIFPYYLVVFRQPVSGISSTLLCDHTSLAAEKRIRKSQYQLYACRKLHAPHRSGKIFRAPSHLFFGGRSRPN